MNFLGKFREILNKIFGTKADELSWKFRHFFDKEWAKSYISKSAIDHPHREFLIAQISQFYPFKKVLEIGSASGANLFLLAKKYPKDNFYGIDISQTAIKTGEEFFKKNNTDNVFLETNSILDLKNFADKSMDVVFTDATIIYVGKNQIEAVLKEMCRIAKKAIILCEQHTEGKSFYNNKWVYNYKEVLKKIIPEAKINFIKIPKNIWAGDWGEYGYIIKVEL